MWLLPVIPSACLLMFLPEIHLFSSSFGLPSAINHFALHTPSCTSGELGPLPFPQLCIWGMWHATDPTHTQTHTHTSWGKHTPNGRIIQQMCRCVEQHFWTPHPPALVVPPQQGQAAQWSFRRCWWKRWKDASYIMTSMVSTFQHLFPTAVFLFIQQ